jgi:hypothetical protein
MIICGERAFGIKKSEKMVFAKGVDDLNLRRKSKKGLGITS